MSETHKPLFNRTYLKAVAWIVAVVIIMLSAGNRSGNDYIQVDKHPSAPVYFSEVDDASYLQIRLLYRTGAAISSQQQLVQQLLQQELQLNLEQLQQSSEFNQLEARLSTVIETDRLVVGLTIPARYSGKNQQIAGLIKGLQEGLAEYPYSGDLEQRWNRLEARQYLAQKDPELRLINSFLDQLSRSDSVHPLQRFPDLYRNRINSGALTITIQGPDSRAIAELSGNQLPGYSLTGDLALTANSPDTQWLSAQGNRDYLLLGLALPGREQTDFLAELLAVQTLQRLLQKQQSEFRLVWKSLDKQGYIAMILPGESRIPEELMDALMGQLDGDQIEATREQLLSRYQQQMATQEAQLGQLDSIAFYGLPLDYLSTFESRLNQVDNSRVKQLIGSYLDPAKQYQLVLPAY